MAKGSAATFEVSSRWSEGPSPDQWAYLAGIRRIEASTVEHIAAEAIRRGLVIGVRAADFGHDEDTRTPWSRPPSGRRRQQHVPEPLEIEVRAVLAQRIFLEKAVLPSPLLNQVKRLAAFQNPDFYKKQGLRLSTALTPRVIACAEEMPEHIALPRGCLPALEDLLRQWRVTLAIEDERDTGSPLFVQFHGQLTGPQRAAAEALLANDIGVFVAPPGVGKTVVGTFLVAQRGCSTLILVHRQPLLEQWVAQLSTFLGIEAKAIGTISGGKRRPNGSIDVAMLQSLVRGPAVDDVVDQLRARSRRRVSRNGRCAAWFLATSSKGSRRLPTRRMTRRTLGEHLVGVAAWSRQESSPVSMR